ncbi:hypothetical protein FRB90_006187 [Tulasnella sp. 427]|nr:hypothetical protein FRB90_006187 [Tulasnella sp. 427]
MSKDKGTAGTDQKQNASSGDAVLDFLMAQDPIVSAASSDRRRPAPNGVDTNGASTTLSAQLNKLEQIINGSGADDEDLGEEEIMELLRQMEEADGIASGLEDKLDGLLENLEGMLKGLEPQDTTSQKPKADGGLPGK